LKIAFAFFLGAIAGVAIFFAMHAPSDIARGDGVPSEAILDEELSASYQVLVQRIAELESQIDALEVEQQSGNASTTLPAGAQTPTRSANSESALSASQQLAERFSEQGFTVERAAWLQRRHDELIAALSSPEMLELDPMYQLRREIGDAEYERYLRATGIDPVILVTGVSATSQAAVFGFQRNDRITSYGGQRVFDHREIRLMEAQGEARESVIVEIIRDGQPMQIYIQRGSFDAGLLPVYPRLPGR
jgi:hypothetical protein